MSIEISASADILELNDRQVSTLEVPSDSQKRHEPIDPSVTAFRHIWNDLHFMLLMIDTSQTALLLLAL